ncbi:MAG: allantoicase [Candidatus Acidiferrales bacterium]
MNDFTDFVDLAAERLGGRVLAANDEFFGPKESLVRQAKPIFVEGKFTERGHWMDGWETRRRRTPGCDWCIIRLGSPGVLRGVVVDTSFFTGNYPARFSLEGCELSGAAPYQDESKKLQAATAKWTELLPETELKGDSQNPAAIAHAGRFTHVRFKIYPDGGVARLRLYGEVMPDAAGLTKGEFDLAAVQNGGRPVASSDQFYSSPLNLLLPGRAKNMGDGWETRRRRGPGHDWVIVKLAMAGTIHRLEIDTAHFKGNFPDSCSVEACYAEGGKAETARLTSASNSAALWRQLLSRIPLKANHRHVFRKQLHEVGEATHVRLNIFPDGGVSRFRVFGRAAQAAGRLTGIERLNHLSRAQAAKALLDCCGSKKWVEQVLARRPFSDAAGLYDASDDAWPALQRKDWLAAFRAHPAIGGKKAAAKQTDTARRWSAGEQSVAQKASPDTLAVLAAANQAYQTTFGHVFLICAADKTSEEILQALRERLANAPEVELRIAAEEQKKITRLRLEKLLGL